MNDLQHRLDTIVKAYDVRGTYPDQFDAEIAKRLGTAFARLVRDGDPEAKRVLIGRDMRPSGPELSGAFAEGITGQGLDVVDLGLISTDQLYFAAGSLDAPGAVLTASHNPAGYNGIKMCGRGAVPVNGDGLATMKAAAAGDQPHAVSTIGHISEQDVLADYVAHVHSFVDLDALKPLKVVADTANGMGGLVVPAAFADLPFDLDHLYPELDGTFPNHPADPIQPKNQADLRARVLEAGADIGLAFDGDADRVFIVDEQAEPISGSLTTAMVAASILDREPGATILHNLICSKTVREVVEEKGGTAVRTRVGHSFIKQDMAATGAAFAGEHSGHYYFRDNWRADSGLIAALVIIEMLCNAGMPLSEMRRPYDRYVASGEINTTVADIDTVIEHVASVMEGRGGECDRLDGLTVDFGDWWFNLRPSNTEPLLRLNLEAASTEACDTRVAEVQAVMAEA
ncbi:MAG: phosphomannomutase/phosphoglucomutase [Actinomycetota bacterium]